MDNIKSRKLLQQLHDEINRTQAVDAKGSELLRDIEMDIRALLDRSEEKPVVVHPSILQRMQGVLDHFETTHPELTLLISRLMDSLSNAGI
jgi:hypothetical protein